MKRLITILAAGWLTANINAFNYTITFIGSQTSTSIGSVVVQNITKGTTITVPAGNVLSLSDVVSSVKAVNFGQDGIYIYPNPISGKSTLSFYVPQEGIYKINVFSVDGRNVTSLSYNLAVGNNQFLLSLAFGVYIVKVNGCGYTYTKRVISQSLFTDKPNISFVGSKKLENSNLQKTRESENVTSMLYSTGDQLLFKGTSGNDTTIVVDKPTQSKTIIFDFIECKDNDGNYYPVVKIGNQFWMAENLRTTKYNDGTEIPEVMNISIWSGLTSGAYCWYNGDTTVNKNTFGGLYNWYAVNTGKLAPSGWHVPTDAEWTDLTTYLGGESVAGRKLKESGTTHWTTSNTSGNNEYGFSALPSGGRSYDGTFYNLGNNCGWWSATLDYSSYSWYRSLKYNSNVVYRESASKTNGSSVRCIRSKTPTVSTTAISNIGAFTATTGGNVTADGSSAVTARGVCWSTSPSPTISDNKTSDGIGTGIYASSLTGLTNATTYYVRAYSTNGVGTAYGAEVSFTTSFYAIGVPYLGGKIAYLDASGIHGFVCALEDQSVTAYWAFDNKSTGATNTSLQTSGVYGISKSGGRKNTDAIILKYGVGIYAASICAALTTGGANPGDWYLPSKGELNQLYLNKNILGGFAASTYWSSSEYNTSFAWSQFFGDGGYQINTFYKAGEQLYVRAIRAF